MLREFVPARETAPATVDAAVRASRKRVGHPRRAATARCLRRRPMSEASTAPASANAAARSIPARPPERTRATAAPRASSDGTCLRLPCQRGTKRGQRLVAATEVAQHFAQMKVDLHAVAVRLQRASDSTTGHRCDAPRAGAPGRARATRRIRARSSRQPRLERVEQRLRRETVEHASGRRVADAQRDARNARQRPCPARQARRQRRPEWVPAAAVHGT